MNERERIKESLNKIAVDGQTVKRLRESEDWKVVYDALVTDIERNMKEMLDPVTTSQRYYELRAEVNAVQRLLTNLDNKVQRGDTAIKQKRELEEV